MNNWPTCLRRDGREKVPFNTWSARWIFFANGIWLRMRRIASAREKPFLFLRRTIWVSRSAVTTMVVINSLVDAGFEEERHFVDHDGLGFCVSDPR